MRALKLTIASGGQTFARVTTQAREGIETYRAAHKRCLSAVTTQAREGIETSFYKKWQEVRKSNNSSP